MQGGAPWRIVAFEIPITRLEGKFKLSQNRSVEERRRVAEALAASDDATERGTASAMRRDLGITPDED